jgi:hypothetical protein
MVMMHELAHNKQMNHSKHFWTVRNEFSSEMKALWEKGYTGEGLWGRGVLLQNGVFAQEELEEGEILPEHLCGGGFRSRGKKRKLKPKITYKERQERRERKIQAKFGSGMTVGADEDTKVKLEKGKRPAGKPRVAGSVRGRELRAAAALARFDVKKEEESKNNDDDLVTDSEGEDEGEVDPQIKSEPDDAVNINGEPLLDAKGRNMVKVCEEEDNDDEDAKLELLELQNMKNSDIRGKIPRHLSLNSTPTPTAQKPEKPQIKTPPPEHSPSKTSPPIKPATPQTISHPQNEPHRPAVLSCPICSVENQPTALTCLVCANVLQPDAIPNSWRCGSSTCRDSSYINAGDVGLCGVCGTRKCSD